MRIGYLILILSMIGSVAGAEIENAELQWEICEPSAESFFQKMNLSSAQDESYQITYFDSAALNLSKHGVFVRYEEKNKALTGKKAKWKVKLEFNSAEDIDFAWMDDRSAKCEMDHYGPWAKPRCAISSKVKSPSDSWSKDQLDLLKTYRPNLDVSNLVAWGPYSGQNFAANFGKDEVSLDATDVPGIRVPVLELSYRVALADAKKAEAQMARALSAGAVILCPKQAGKFPHILDLLAGRP